MSAYRIQVIHIGTGEWITMKTRYKDKKVAQSWVSWVKKVWHSPRGRVRAEHLIAKDHQSQEGRG